MSEIRRTAGQCSVTISTAGWPTWVRIFIGETDAHGLRPADLHDLRYCIDRALAELAKDGK